MRRCAEHEGSRRPLLLRKRQELRRKLAQTSAIERHKFAAHEAVEDRKQQQWVFGRLTKCFRLFDQQACPLRRRLSFRRGIPFDMHKRGYERDLKLDLLRDAARAWRARSQSAQARA